MRIALGLLILLLAASGQTIPIASEGRNTLEAVVTKTGFLRGKRHILRWTEFAGTAQISPPSVEFTVRADSVQVLDDWLGEGKREDVRKEAVGKNVLNAAADPEIRFRSTKVDGSTEGELTVTGDLTIRGVTRPVTVRVRRNGGFWEGETSFAMTRFGIKPPSAILGAIGTQDSMTIRFRIAVPAY